MSKTLKFILIALGVIVVLVIISKVFGNKDKKSSVETVQAELRTITETVSASGKIQPETEVKIISEVSGQLIDLPIKEGDEVQSGDLLARINPDIYQSALERAVAALNSAKSNLENVKSRLTQSKAQFKVAQLNYDRNKTLLAQGAISKSEFDTAESNFEVAQAEVAAAEQSVLGAEYSIKSSQASKTEAEDNLKRTYIFAPRNGTVTALSVENGDVVTGTGMMSGDELMRISNLEDMEVNVEVNESDIVRVHVGDTAEIEIDAYLKEKFLGVVTEIGNTALNSTGMMSTDQVTNFPVKINVLKSSYEHLKEGNEAILYPLRPGMSATVDIRTSKVQNVISIPIKGVTTREDTAKVDSFKERMAAKKERKEASEEIEPITCVFIFENGKAEIRPVETGTQDNKYIEIKSGLNEGDEVIVGPYNAVSRQLKPGENVEKLKP